jgi:lipopolysaccharide transport system ATP-binding protein
VPNSVIQVENLSKRYRIGVAQTRDTLISTIAGAIGSPIANLRRIRNLTRFENGASDETDTIWALKDVSFDVKTGERIGIIGQNGAGKSTLLKIMSRIIEPTSGQITTRGSISSLLEVGTGFHPELTGRENIFLNGSILGLSSSDIKLRFDEIVEFSGILKFIDTPIKRYSTGMKMRLAFSVAAHLEPDILLIDEVLAVGDAEFQQKCLGKMESAAEEGRTVVFVSHNMPAMLRLVDRCILLDSGQVAVDGDPREVIDAYLQENIQGVQGRLDFDDQPELAVQITSVVVQNPQGHTTPVLKMDEQIDVEIDYVVRDADQGQIDIVVILSTRDGVPIFVGHSRDTYTNTQISSPGRFRLNVGFPGRLLNSGRYALRSVVNLNGKAVHNHPITGTALEFEISEAGKQNPSGLGTTNTGALLGIKPTFKLTER